MQSYLISLLVTAMVLAVIGILTPGGERDGLSKHVRLVAALTWICILISPVLGGIEALTNWWNGEISFSEEIGEADFQTRLDEALDSSSKAYFCDMLTQTLEERFSITPGDLRCYVTWKSNDGGLSPEKVTLLLSGNAVWQSPREMEQFVTELIGCECVSSVDL